MVAGVGTATALYLFVNFFVIVVFFVFCGVGVATSVHLLLYADVVAALHGTAAVRHGDRACSGYREKGDEQYRKVSLKGTHK